MDGRGILIGCDHNAEWLLPIWYEAYEPHASLPVAVADFGMNDVGHRLCSTLGFRMFQLPFSGPHIHLAKPQAIMASPFDCTLWLDLDCEVRTRLDSIFDELSVGFGITQLEGQAEDGRRHSNAGVILAEHGNALLDIWAATCRLNADKLASDEIILNRLLNTGLYDFDVLDRKWNRGGNDPVDIGCAIYHWFGPTGHQRLAAKHGLDRNELCRE